MKKSVLWRDLGRSDLPLPPVKTLKQIHLQKSWNNLVRQIEPDPCVLLKGSDNHFILGWDFEAEFKANLTNFNFKDLQAFLDQHQGNYIFGYLTYDLKNKIEPQLTSSNDDLLEFPVVHFLVASHVLEHKESTLNYFGELDEKSITTLFEFDKPSFEIQKTAIQLKPKTSKEDYLKNVESILSEIQFGNIYEMNYCVNFSAEDAELKSFETFVRLNEIADAPFSAYLNLGDHFIISASPERYLQKMGIYLKSEPIKGTARRGKNVEEDQAISETLKNDPKERAENIMIVDLVRNDLSKIATKNSVKVDSLCEVKSFKTVHQLVSTVSCKMKPTTNFTDVIKATFPMGSMTGAPKISAMEIAERTENFRRGLYSGTIGYINPLGDYDFNVVIRSILYNRNKKVVSCSVGGAITINAKPENEYDECLLKLQALQQALC
jgi:para-aminobenzoate synthetase component 1